MEVKKKTLMRDGIKAFEATGLINGVGAGEVDSPNSSPPPQVRHHEEELREEEENTSDFSVDPSFATLPGISLPFAPAYAGHATASSNGVHEDSFASGGAILKEEQVSSSEEAPSKTKNLASPAIPTKTSASSPVATTPLHRPEHPENGKASSVVVEEDLISRYPQAQVSVEHSPMSDVTQQEPSPSFSLGIESIRAERDTAYAIAFINPYIRRLLKHYKDDPFWSEASKKILEICLLDRSDEWLSPEAVLDMVGADKMSEAERRRALSSAQSYLKARTPADAAVLAKTIIYRLKVSRLHGFLRDYDQSQKTSEDVDTLVSRIIYVSKHYGSALEAKTLTKLSIDGLYQSDEDREIKIFPSFFAPMNEYLGFGGYMPGQLVSVAGAPGRGKTTFLLNEAVNFALMGKNVLYFALADMTEEDIILKAISILSGNRLMQNIINRSGKTALLEEIDAYYYDMTSPEPKKESPFFDLSPASLIRRDLRAMLDDPFYSSVLSRIQVVADSESRPHIEDVQSTVMSLEVDPDVVIVDYDRSVKARTDEGLYQEGEEIYEGLVSIAKPKSGKKKLVMVASQINKSYWSRAEVPLEALAESSRKQAISDIVITVGKDLSNHRVHVGAISLAKERRGRTSSFGYILLPTNQIYPWDLELSAKEKSEEVRRKVRKRISSEPEE